MSITKEMVNDIFGDLFQEFKTDGGIKFDGAPVKIDYDSIYQFIIEHNNKFFELIRIASGVSLIKGSKKITKEDLETAMKISNESLERFLGHSW